MKKKKEQPIIPFNLEILGIDELKPHPNNYRDHPDDQLEHVVESLKKNGQYKNIVIAKDGTILAGHGVWTAAKKLKIKQVAVVRLKIAPDDPRAIKVLTGDNEIGKLAIVDDRKLTELLKQLSKETEGLLGSGINERQLANLIFVTRPSSEIKDFSAAAEWVGLPDYDTHSEDSDTELTLQISFQNEEDRVKFVEENKIKIRSRIGRKWITVWPFRERYDRASVKFDAEIQE